MREGVMTFMSCNSLPYKDAKTSLICFLVILWERATELRFEVLSCDNFLGFADFRGDE